MPLSFYAEDNQFAVATGANVNDNNDGTSTFDYPPNSTKDLIVTSNSADADERLFEVGESYSLSFGGNGGGVRIDDAVVIRSDILGGNMGAIAFEGLDQNGDLTQVVWSPNFDLEQWYWDNFDGGASPGFYTYERDASEYRFACFVAGSIIETLKGPVTVESLKAGDMVRTVDHGFQPLVWNAVSTVPGIGRGAPVQIAAEVFGTDQDLSVSGNHRMLLKGSECELYFEAAEVLVPAKFLVDGVRVRRLQTRETRYHHLVFERHELVFANGVPSESFFLGDDTAGIVDPGVANEFEAKAGFTLDDPAHNATSRRVLRAHEAPVARAILSLKMRDQSVAPPSFLFAA